MREAQYHPKRSHKILSILKMSMGSRASGRLPLLWAPSSWRKVIERKVGMRETKPHSFANLKQ
jgi:hypothetical protein